MQEAVLLTSIPRDSDDEISYSYSLRIFHIAFQGGPTNDSELESKMKPIFHIWSRRLCGPWPSAMLSQGILGIQFIG